MTREELPVRELMERAKEALTFAYAPYSKFKVGAALLGADGSIYTGCNIENASAAPGSCAERTAFFKAVSEGAREFDAICIVSENREGNHDFCPPCGVCRQVMAEFCNPDTFYIILPKEEEYAVYTLGELFPLGFGPNNLD